MIDRRLFDLVSRRVPGYTSYPPEPFPQGGVSPHEYAVWLSTLADTREPVSLHLRVPNCREICFHRGCVTKATLRDEPLRMYVETLRREFRLVMERTGRLPVSHIKWNGGTSSLLPEEAFFDLVADIFASFDMSAGYVEHAIELDPRHVDRRLTRRLARCGIDRAGLAVHDTDATVQALIGRPQAFSTVQTAVDDLAAAGIDDLDFALIHGLPAQTARTMATTIERVMTIQPDRITLSAYTHTPEMKSIQRRIDPRALPSNAARVEITHLARDLIIAAGYVAIGIDHYALPGDGLVDAWRQRRLRRNVQGYTDDQARHVIGLGTSSIGRVPLGYVQNASNLTTWRDAIEDGRFAIAKGRRLSLVDRMRAEIIEDLMCYFEADLAAIATRHGRSCGVLKEDLTRLQPLADAGFVRLEDGKVRIIADEVMLATVVASAFDAHLAEARPESVAA